MRDKIAVKFCLAVAMISDRIIEIDQSLVRHQFAQTTHHFIGTLNICSKVSPRIREQNGQVDIAEKNGVEDNSGRTWVPQTKCQWKAIVIVSLAESSPYKIGTVSPVEDSSYHLDAYLSRLSVVIVTESCFDPFRGGSHRLTKISPILGCKTA